MNYWKRREQYYRRRHKTVCAVCGSVHKGEFSNWRTQGTDCASMVFERNNEWVVLCCYGSTHYDCDAYRFIRPVPDVYKKADPVCDECVKNLIDNKLVEQIPGEFPFGLDPEQHGFFQDHEQLAEYLKKEGCVS